LLTNGTEATGMVYEWYLRNQVVTGWSGGLETTYRRYYRAGNRSHSAHSCILTIPNRISVTLVP